MSSFKEYLEQVTKEKELFRVERWKKNSTEGLVDYIFTTFKNLDVENELSNSMSRFLSEPNGENRIWYSNEEFVEDLIDAQTNLRITDQKGDLVFYEKL